MNSTFPTTASGEAVIGNPLTINTSRVQSADLSVDEGERTHALRITASGGGNSLRIRDPAHRAKAEAFWTALAAKRKTPGNCCRCGKPHTGEFRQCDRCREKVAMLKKRRQVGKMDLAQCIALVLQCRREVTKLRQIIKQMKRHYEYRRDKRAANRRALRKYAACFPTISKQELSQICHAYDS